MKLPLVRRAVYDADLDYLRAKLEAEREVNALLRSELIEQRSEVREANGLVKALLAPMLEKQKPREPAPPREMTPGEKQWAEVRKIAREQSFGDLALHAHLTTYANELKRQGLSADEVAGRLVQWQTSDLATEDHT